MVVPFSTLAPRKERQKASDLIRHSAMCNECMREKQISATAIEFAHTGEERYPDALLRGECV